MKLTRIYSIYLTILILLLSLPVMAADLRVKDFAFTHLGTFEGLSSQRVYSLRKTSDHAAWWTTRHGVDRFNGWVVKNYPLGDKATFSSFAGRVVKFCHSIAKNREDDLYVFDNTGCIYKYNKVQDRFDLVANVAKQMNAEVLLNDVLVTDECIWLAMREGAYQLFPDRNNEMKDVIGRHFTNHVLPYRDKILFCSGDGAFDEKKNKIWDYDVISACYDKENKALWIGTFNDGVKIIRDGFETKTVSMPSNPVRAIRLYGDKMLIGIDGFGVYQASRSGDDAKPLFSSTEGPNGVLHGNGVYDILVDAWNNIVVCSYSGGIDVARPAESTTAVFRHIANNPQSLINDHVNSVAQWSNDQWLMGTDDGVSIYNCATDSWRHVARGMVVLDMCKEPDGKLLLATYGNGVCEVSADGSTRKVYSSENGILKNDYVYKLCYDKAGNLWMGTLFGSLTVRTAQGFKYYNVDNILSLTSLADGRMAIGSAHGLYIAGSDDDAPRKIDYMPDGKTDANRYVVDMFEDSDGKLWVATDGGGVYIINSKTGKVLQQIEHNNGLPSNSVNSITKDRTGRIWLGTDKGLVFVDPQKPTEVFNVSYGYGLNTEFVQHAVANLQNGEIIYGTVEGAIVINPKKISKELYKADLRILGVRVHDENGADDTDEFRQHIADGLAKGEIRLAYGERSFDVLFETINMRSRFDMTYQYKMEGMEWSQANRQQWLNFENLEPGKHVLTIRCVSRASGGVIDEKTVTIYIGQPWWNTWWMWCIYVLLLILAFHGAWRMYDLHNKYLRMMRDRVAMPTEHSEEQTMGNGIDNRNVKENDSDNKIENNNDNEDENEEVDDDEPEETDEGRQFVELATKLTLANLKDNDFTIDSLCREMGMSRTLFYVKLKTYTGKSPQDFVRAIRLEKAVSLLRSGRTVTEVSVLTGFDNPKYFSTVFKKYFGVSPSKFE